MKKQQAEHLNPVDVSLGFAPPAGLAAAYLRAVAGSLESFGEFGGFLRFSENLLFFSFLLFSKCL